MKLLCLFLQLWILFFICPNSLWAQSLTEQLVREDPEKLVEAARKNGNVIRGAILFHQGNINCAKCHRPTTEADRIGPDLSRLGADVTDLSFVESILSPSRSVKKEFETVAVLTNDGRLVHGMVANEDPEKLVLHDGENVGRLITILRTDIDEIRPGLKSTMPDGLVDELKNRQQFYDLLRYVIETRDRGPASQVAVTNRIGRRRLDPNLEGAILMQELNCGACHEGNMIDTGIAAKQAPDLNWSRRRINPDYLERFIFDPHGTKPGTTMPDVLGHLGRADRKETVDAIAHFLQSDGENLYRRREIDQESVKRGAKLFHSIGCVACHSPRNQQSIEIAVEDSIALGTLVNKYGHDSLVEFLENPHVVRSSGRMPNMLLKHEEAVDLAQFLLQNEPTQSDPIQNSRKQIEKNGDHSARGSNVDLALAQKGRKLFLELGCATCHPSVVELAELARVQKRLPALDKSSLDQGCLSGENGVWPDFRLNENQKQLIRNVIRTEAPPLSDEERISVALRTFNCIACHSRGDLGGVTLATDSHFQTTNMNLGDQGRIPPTLSGVGAKLKQKWMRDVLVNGRSIRPYMNTRMPQYGEGNIGHLVGLFQKTDDLPEVKPFAFKNRNEIRKTGLQIVGNQGLNCIACHTYKFKQSDTMPAVDLTEMADRLKKNWFHHYMLEPQRFSSNTVMPSFWPGGKAIRHDIEGDSAFQLEAIWQYLADGRQGGMPRGVVRERLEIVVGAEAQMLRRAYPGIGKRGVGVGYPGGSNLAWDAEQMRLGMIWKGAFVDPGGVWTGQGSGNVRPLSRPVQFAKGPDLDNDKNPWLVDEGRPTQHQFRGYSLDDQRRPKFKYQFQNIDVEDYFTQGKQKGAGPKLLVRKLTLHSTTSYEGLRFRVATSKEMREDENGRFLLGGGVSVQIVSPHRGHIVDRNGEKWLAVPLQVEANEKQELVFEYLME